MIKVDSLRKVIVGGIITIVVIVLGYSGLYVFNLVPSFGGKPDPYVVLDRELQTEPLVVEEFFTFSCEHCRNFDPLILNWAEDLPDGVEFTQTHIAFTRTDDFLAKSFLVLSARDAIDENRQRLFAEIHDKQNRFLSPDSIADFIDGNGISKEAFLALYRGDRITRLAQEKHDHIVDVQVTSVPFVLVGNKYGVFVSQGRREAVNTIDFIVTELLAGREPPPLDKDESEDSPPDVDTIQNTESTTDDLSSDVESGQSDSDAEEVSGDVQASSDTQ